MFSWKSSNKYIFSNFCCGQIMGYLCQNWKKSKRLWATQLGKWIVCEKRNFVSPSDLAIFFLLYKIPIIGRTFLKIFWRFPTTFRRFSKSCRKAPQTFPTFSTTFRRWLSDFRKFSRIAKDYQRLPMTIRRCFDDTPIDLSTVKGSRWYHTSVNKNDIFTCRISFL